jgi:pyruvate dehydrogenase E1 component
VIWGSGWDPLLAQSTDGALIDLMNATPDGDYQTYRAENGAFIRDNFFGRDPRTKALVEDLSDDDIWWKLNRGGHDAKKIYAAFQQAMTLKNGKPTVILAHTIKGYRLGSNFAGRNATHQMKKFTLADLKALRDTLHIPVSDEQLESGSVYDAPFYLPADDSPVMQYLKEHRSALGGAVPSRSTEHKALELPGDKA